ncbi:MAG TPA: helical backbone metal receptor [Chitinophagaceae bacterium]|nr:helical backbone metal receptor [Chitinophagaceae bacterium]
MLFTDQTGQTIDLPAIPRRIISLVPSQTELLADLGLDKEVTGITKFCVHPKEWFHNKTRIGGTKQLHVEKIKELQPDLIIANKEENVKEQIEELSTHFPVWISDVNDLASAYQVMQQIGAMTNKELKANKIIAEIKHQFQRLTTPDYRLRTAYLIWQKPYMTIGSDTFIHSMLHVAGFNNIFADQQRYPEISMEEIKSVDPEILLLPSEPFPFKEIHASELQKQLPNTKIILVDGELFSWYGSRLLKAPAYFEHLQKEINNFKL